MTPRFVFHPAARDELREALEWYDAQRSGLGDELLDIVRAAIDRVGEFPDLYPEVARVCGAPFFHGSRMRCSIAAPTSPIRSRFSPSSITGVIRRRGTGGAAV
jgi:hypothetical protein